MAVIAAAVVISERGGGDDGGSAESRAARIGTTAAGVCEARDAAAAGDVPTARDRFVDVHGRLHEVADRLANSERASDVAKAADLLVAKREVEEVIDEPDPAHLVERLDQLASATARADGFGAGESCG